MPIGDNAHRGLTAPRRAVVDAAGYAIGLVLAALAAIRRGKAVHPHGAVYEAELTIARDRNPLVGEAELFLAPGPRPALVRFSRSLGLPRPLPNLLGMSIRVPDAYGTGRHQDFLMVTTRRRRAAFQPVERRGRPGTDGPVQPPARLRLPAVPTSAGPHWTRGRSG